MTKAHHLPLIPGKIYHLFNRAVGNEKLFNSKENYLYFLRKYGEHSKAVCDTYCYCLLPNHFHLLVKIKDDKNITDHFQRIKGKEPDVYDNIKLSDFIMERVGNWLNSYTKAFNKMYNRKGALFMDYTKRTEIEKDNDFCKIIHYILANPVHHGLVKTIEEWPYSSYHSFLSDSPTRLLRNEILDWFGGKKQFMEFHRQPIHLKLSSLLEVNL